MHQLCSSWNAVTFAFTREINGLREWVDSERISGWSMTLSGWSL